MRYTEREPMKQIPSFFAPVELIKRLDKLANKEGYSRSELIRQAIEMLLDSKK